MKSWCLREILHFRQLPEKARVLIVSYFYQGAAYPLISLFIDAFIWRNTHDLVSVALYNLGNFLALPAGFILTGHLLRRLAITRTYVLGLLLLGASAAAVVFFSGGTTVEYLLFGCFYGLGNGLYWASRNYLSLEEIASEKRNYFTAFTFALDWVTSIIVPFIAGWAITLGESYGWYSHTVSYWGLLAIAFVFALLSGFAVRKTPFATPVVKRILVGHISKRWNGVRLITIGLGAAEGLNFFVPTLLVLTKFGNEGILGTVSAIAAFATSFATYLYGRYAGLHHQKSGFLISVIGLLTATVFLAVAPEPWGLLVYAVVSFIPLSFQWLTIHPLLQDITKQETQGIEGNRFALVVDNELFLNVGRFFGMGILFFFIFHRSEHEALYVAPFVATTVQMVLVLLSWKSVERSTSLS